MTAAFRLRFVITPSVVMLAVLFCIALSSVFLSFSARANVDVDAFRDTLSREELRWLKQNPAVSYTGDPDWLPFEAFENTGNYTGIVADHLALIETLTGITFQKIRPKNWTEALALAVEGRVDVISGDKADEVLNTSYTPVTPYIHNRISVVMRNTIAPIEDLNEIAGLDILILRGYGYTADLKREYPDIEFKEIENVHEGLEKVSSGMADALVVSKTLGAYSMAVEGYHDLKFVGSTRVNMALTFFVANNKKELWSIVDKALAFITPSQHLGIVSRWSGRSSDTPELSVSLTRDEREYLKRISPIRFTGDPNWLPYEAFDAQGKYVGEVADHLELIQNLLGTPFTIIPTETWSESIALARSGKIDILSETDSSVLADKMLFTREYTSSPVVIVMKNSEHFVDGIESIKERKIALIKDYGNAVDIRKRYQNIQFHDVDSIQEGLISVSSGEVDALLCNSAQALFHIKRLGLQDVKITGQTEFETRLAFAVNPDKARLVTILNKALDVIYLSPEQQRILDNWSDVEYVQKVDYSLIYKILIAGFVVLLAGVAWTYRLKKDIERRRRIEYRLSKAKEAASSANEAKSRFLAVMSHELRTPLNGILGMLELLENSELNVEQSNTVRIAKESSGNLLSILNDILDFSKIEADKMDVSPTPTNIKNLVETCVNALAQNAYDKNLRLRMFADPSLNTKYLIDPVRVRQIISNFINNAIKFTLEGEISVVADAKKLDNDQIEFSISIVDTGIGISEKNQRLLFQEFVQVDMESKRQFGGTGLGLSICKKLSQLMGGRIELTSEVGKGSHITYKQKATLAELNPKTESKWSNFSFAVLTEDDFTRQTLDNYLHYFGAHTFMPIVLPEDTASLKHILRREKVDGLIVSEDLLSSRYTEFLQSSEIPGLKVIKLVAESNLSANNFMADVGVLNTNPLQPRFLELLIDLCLGIEEDYDILPESTYVETTAKSVKLLIAEDHPTNQELITRQLDYLGYPHRVVNHGQEALKAWQEGGFDGILTDCHMPLMDGYELAQAIRNQGYNEVPIIAMTANAMSGERARCIKSGMNDLLVKPVSLMSLASCLATWFHAGDHKVLADARTPRPMENKALLKKLESVFFGAENVLPMLASYWEATQSDIQDLHRALKKEDRLIAKQVAHRIKGAAKIVMANEIVSLSQDIETKAGDTPFAELIGKVEELDKALDAHRENLAGSGEERLGTY